MSQDLSLFLGQMLRRPHRVVALAPSSEALARLMAAQVPAPSPDQPGGPVIELGAGTGKITRALLESGIAPDQLHLFELNDRFVTRLRDGFPDTHVHHAPAQSMTEAGLTGARAVVSGLPFLSMPLAVQRAILTATFTALRPGAPFIQFTYGPTPPVAESLRLDLGLSWQKSHRVWGNLPPARVYTFRQQPH